MLLKKERTSAHGTTAPKERDSLSATVRLHCKVNASSIVESKRAVRRKQRIQNEVYKRETAQSSSVYIAGK